LLPLEIRHGGDRRDGEIQERAKYVEDPEMAASEANSHSQLIRINSSPPLPHKPAFQ
jgi:hypothetical protein